MDNNPPSYTAVSHDEAPEPLLPTVVPSKQMEMSQVPQSPQYGIPPMQRTPQMVPNNTVIVQQPVILGPNPVECNCYVCHQHIITGTKAVPGTYTWMMCIIFCCLFGVFGLIPFCCDDCQDVEHRCPNCRTVISVYKRK